MQTQPEEQPPETSSLLHRNRDLAILYDIAGYLNRIVDVRKALQEVLIRVTELLELRTGWVWLLGENGTSYLAASQALPPYLADHPERMSGSCVCLDTFLSDIIPGPSNIDVLRCSRLKNAERDSDPSALGLRFHASIPINAGTISIGVLNVASEDWRELRPEELQLLHIIGDQIGLALQRAHLSAERTRAAASLATTEERNRLAREIHDTLAQGLAAITLQLETADALLETRPERAQDAIKSALKVARRNLEEARRSVMDLRAAPLQKVSLPLALASLSDELALQDGETEEQGPTFHYSYSPSPDFPALPARIEAGLYRIAQEALQNALRHAQAQHIELSLAADDHQVQLIIQDDGVGFDPDTIQTMSGEGHFGLAGMGERAKLLQGTICISSEPGSGTSIVVAVPY
jgi:two-component system NarL family sensor kinase